MHQIGQTSRELPESGAEMHQIGPTPARAARIWCRNAPNWPNSRASCPNLVRKCTRSAQPPRERSNLVQKCTRSAQTSRESGAEMHQIGQTSREMPEPGAEMHQIGPTPARAPDHAAHGSARKASRTLLQNGNGRYRAKQIFLSDTVHRSERMSFRSMVMWSTTSASRCDSFAETMSQ